MKTAEHYLMRWRDNEFELHELIELAQKESFKEGQSSPKIKKLEWFEYKFADALDFNYWEATTNFGKYFIKQRFDMGGKFYAWILNKVFLFNTLNEAKQACQGDYERRVKECLE